MDIAKMHSNGTPPFIADYLYRVYSDDDVNLPTQVPPGPRCSCNRGCFKLLQYLPAEDAAAGLCFACSLEDGCLCECPACDPPLLRGTSASASRADDAATTSEAPAKDPESTLLDDSNFESTDMQGLSHFSDFDVHGRSDTRYTPHKFIKNQRRMVCEHHPC